MGVPRHRGFGGDLGNRKDGHVAIAGKRRLLQDRARDARGRLRRLLAGRLAGNQAERSA
jgi:hypothetical protein